ncbi:hypothetical protein A5787_01210 [Mycobacterium sp. 852002-50816_SCH5313054-b]|nr:hypothetical protein A5787_01210 [Mycobacterium sp. 852002-50816_SCH5313054-b]
MSFERRCDFRDRLNNACLVVGAHHRNQEGVRSHCIGDGGRIYPTAPGWRYQGDFKAAVGEHGKGFEDSFVLDLGRDDVPSTGLGSRRRQPEDHQVVALGCAAGKCYFVRLCVDDARDLLAGTGHPFFGDLPVGVRTTT